MAVLVDSSTVVSLPSAKEGISIFRSINTRLMLTLIALEVLPLVVICGAGYYFARQALGTGPAAEAAAERILIIDVVALLVSLATIVVVGFMSGRAVTKPVLETAKLAERIGHGDLREAVPSGSANDELSAMIRGINEMAEYIRGIAAMADDLSTGDISMEVELRSEDDVLGLSFQRMVSSLHQIASSLTADAHAVTDATNSLLLSARQAQEASQQITSAMEAVVQGTAEGSQRIARIAQGAEDQRRAVLATSDTINQMSQAIEQVAVNAQAVASTSDSAYQAASEGGERVRQAVESMNSIRDAVVQSAAQIRVLGDTSKQISTISEFIGDIAEQTNLLALNAAIEAARAGEHGRGFAVVAEEVRKLAARSANATSQISSLTGKISVDTRQAIEAMEMGVSRAEDGSALAARAGQALQAILVAVQQTNDQIQNISAAAEEMTASSGEVVAAINHISQIVVQNSEATEQMSEMSQSNADVTEAVSASASQLSGQVNAIYASAERLSGLSSSLRAAVESFRL